MAKKKKTEVVEVVAKCDNLIPESEIENMIFSIRGIQVMVDRDLAMLYGVETKVLNQAVKRNINRFPERFRFRQIEIIDLGRWRSTDAGGLYSHAQSEGKRLELSHVVQNGTVV